jgi:hypothetical protein
MRSPSGVNAELGGLHRVEVVVVGGGAFATAAEAPGHRLEGDVAEGRGDGSCMWMGKATKVSTKGQAVCSDGRGRTYTGYADTADTTTIVHRASSRWGAHNQSMGERELGILAWANL